MSGKSVDMAAILRWDVRNWTRAVECWNQVLPCDLDGHTALEMGAGEGGLSLFLADRGCHVTCTDIASSASARKHHDQYSLTGEIEYTSADATNLPFGDCTFDFAAFKSVLGGIGRHIGLAGQQRAIGELHRVLKPGGILIFADNLRATWVHRFVRRTFVPWGHDWRYPSLVEFRNCFTIFDQAHIHTFGLVAAIGRTEAQRSWLHHLDRLLSPLAPPAARYIGYGYAVK